MLLAVRPMSPTSSPFRPVSPRSEPSRSGSLLPRVPAPTKADCSAGVRGRGLSVSVLTEAPSVGVSRWAAVWCCLRVPSSPRMLPWRSRWTMLPSASMSLKVPSGSLRAPSLDRQGDCGRGHAFGEVDHPVAEVDRSGGDRRTVGQSDGVPRDLERAVRERRALGQVQGPVAELEAAVRQRDRARRQWRDLDVARAPEAYHDVADLGQARAGCP